jgi:hypothetical protein
MCPGDFVSMLEQFFALELEKAIALHAVQMIVLGIAVVVFIDAAAVEFESP